MTLESLPDLFLEPLVRNALEEDLGRAGDITTNAVIPADQRWSGVLAAREAGIIAGLDLARLSFRMLDAAVDFEPHMRDGAKIKPGVKIATISGSARTIITGERVALNFLSHMSGIATATRK